jgi:hypothetical protein
MPVTLGPPDFLDLLRMRVFRFCEMSLPEHAADW